MVSERVCEMAGAMVVPSTIVPDGQLIVVDRRGGVFSTLVIGVTSSGVQETAHRIVRAGLTDVLQWLGQPTLTGRQLIEQLRTWGSR